MIAVDNSLSRLVLISFQPTIYLTVSNLYLCLFQALIAAVNETEEEDIRQALRSQTESQLALVPRGPRLLRDSIAHKTTVDTDDTVNSIKLNVIRPGLVSIIFCS